MGKYKFSYDDGDLLLAETSTRSSRNLLRLTYYNMHLVVTIFSTLFV